MKSTGTMCISAITSLAALLASLQLPAQNRTRYAVIDLSTLGGTISLAYGLNDRGSVVGFSSLPGDASFHAFLWREGKMTDLGTLSPADPVPFSAAYSINDNDEVVGLSETSTADSQNICGDSRVCLPVVWRDGAITALPTLGGTDGEASAINNHGQIVGIAQSDELDPLCQDPVLKPTVWEDAQARALPTAPFLDGIVGGAPGPAGNNDQGEVVGIITRCDGSSSRGVLWAKHTVIDMGTIAGAIPVPVSVNDKAQAVGTYTTTDGINHAFLWQDGVITDLGNLPGDAFTSGNSINSEGQVIGQSCGPTGCDAFLWQDGVMTNLNSLFPNDSLRAVDPFAVNARGQIVGVAIQKNTGEPHAFLATPYGEDHLNCGMVDANVGIPLQRCGTAWALIVHMLKP